MPAGKYRHRITFQQPPDGTDEDGFPLTEPVEYLTVWAQLKTLRGSRFYDAAQSNMERNREFIIRYRKELTDGVRPDNLQVFWNEVTHDLVSIEDDDGLHKTMTVIVRAVS